MVNVAATLERLKESVTKCRQSMNIEMDRLKKAKVSSSCYFTFKVENRRHVVMYSIL